MHIYSQPLIFLVLLMHIFGSVAFTFWLPYSLPSSRLISYVYFPPFLRSSHLIPHKHHKYYRARHTCFYEQRFNFYLPPSLHPPHYLRMNPRQILLLQHLHSKRPPSLGDGNRVVQEGAQTAHEHGDTGCWDKWKG